MRLTAALLLAGFLHVGAHGYTQGISLTLKNVPLEKALQAIELQSGYQFFYRLSLVPAFGKVDIRVRDATLRETLDLLLKDQPLSYDIVDNTVVLKEKGRPGMVGEGKAEALMEVKGSVVDEKDVPVYGASVSIKGSTKGTSTDQSGNFTIIAKTGDVLVISFVGLQTREVKVQRSGALGVVRLLFRNEQLQDVVVNNGYQTLSKERSVGSFTKPEMSVVASRSTSMDLLQRLDGLVPGLTLNNAPNVNSNLVGPSSTMGATMFPVLLRGLTSVNSNTQPLYVVDGIPVNDFSNINPNDVEDITVLKDATASSIWGARAANGVIVVTTKRGGAPGERIKVDYDAFLALQGKPDIGVFPTMNSRQYIGAAGEIMRSAGYTDLNSYGMQMSPTSNNAGYYSAIYPHEVLLFHQLSGTPLTYMPSYYAGKSLDDLGSFDNLRQIKDNFYRNAYLMNHTVSLRGSAGRYSVYGSLSYTDTKDPYPGDDNHVYKLNARQDYSFNKGFQMYLVTDLTNSRTTISRGIYPDSRFLPYAAFRDVRGNPLDMSWLLANDSVRFAAERKSVGLRDLGQLDLSYYPLTDMHSGYTKSDDLNIRLTTGFRLRISGNLRAEGLYGAVINNGQTSSYDDIMGERMQQQLGRFTLPVGGIPPYAGSDPVTQITPFLPTTGGKYATNNVQSKSWTIRHQLLYDRSWSEDLHQLTALAGIESQQQTTNFISTGVYGYDRNLLTYKPVDLNTLAGNGLKGGITGSLTGRDYLSQDELFNSHNTDTRFISYYGNAAYTYRKRYSVNVSSRYDRSNMFGTERSAQSRPVWSAGGGWMLSNENFMSGITWVDRLSIRGTYGITGNAPIPPGAANKDILSPGYIGGDLPAGAVTTLLINTPANKTLTWEQTQNTNLGLDFSVLGHRISGSIDYYHKHTTNLISLVPLNTFAGFGFVKGNLGTINNNGIELRLNARNVSTRSFSWTTQLNVSLNKGKILSLNTSTFPVQSATQVLGGIQRYNRPDGFSYSTDLAGLGLVAGYQPFNLFAYRYAGLDEVGDPQIRLADKTVTKNPYRLVPISDVRSMGSYTPLYTGGITNNFQYKQFTLSVNIVFNLGFVIRRDVNDYYSGRLGANAEGLPTLNSDGSLFYGSSAFNRGNLYADFATRWKRPGDEKITNMPAFSNDPARASQASMAFFTLADVNVVNGSYAKMRDLSLSYTLPQALLARVKANSITFRVQLNNVMVWKANRFGIDPEFQNAPGGQGNMYTSSGNYVPVGNRVAPFNQHSITFGLHVGI